MDPDCAAVINLRLFHWQGRLPYSNLRLIPRLVRVKTIHRLALMAPLAMCFCTTPTLAQTPPAPDRVVVRVGSLPSTRGPEQNFTGKVRVDLYDRADVIPFDRITAFFEASLKRSSSRGP